MALLRERFVTAMCGLCMGVGLLGGVSAAYADPTMTPDDNVSFSEGNSSSNMAPDSAANPGSEKKTVHGHRSLPPGYQDAPSMDFEHGDDPDHLANVHRDSVTGADISRYGSAYQSSGPVGSGQVGDSTGNGWVIPR